MASPADSSTDPAGGAPDDVTEVLIVDDHPAICEALKTYIDEAGGMRVVDEVRRAREAFHVAEDEKPDVVVVDISLGNVDGITLTRRIRTEVPESEVLVYSMYDKQKYAKRAIRAGASCYLPKDEPIDTVVDAIRDVDDGDLCMNADVTTELLTEIVEGRQSASGLSAFTNREMTVFQMLGDGNSVAEISEHLDLSRKTVETYRRRAKEKLGCDTVDEFLQKAVLWTQS